MVEISSLLLELTEMEKYLENLNYLKTIGIQHEFINFNVLGGEQRSEIKSEQICKALVAKGKKSGYIILSIPINRKADFNKVKSFLNDSKVRLVDNVKEVSSYEHGANGPLPIHKEHPEYLYLFDDSLMDHKFLVSNIGKYAHSVITSSTDLITTTNGQIGDFIQN